MSAELKCSNGTVIKISDETEAELRKVFEPKLKPNYKDYALGVYVNEGFDCPITIRIARDSALSDKITRNVKDTEVFIVALQEVVAYCKQHKLGLD